MMNFTDNGQKTTMSSTKKVAIDPEQSKTESILMTHPTNIYTKFEKNWVISLSDNDNGCKPSISDIFSNLSATRA